jgi:hypothetical protein
MIRALASVKAAEEINLLTAGARSNALQMTQRAAQLATQTEEAAHHRAGKIIEAAALPAGPDDLNVLNERIVHLRSTIAAVQDRLGSIESSDAGEAPSKADEAPAEAGDAPTEVIELDLRDGADEPKPKTPRKRRPATATKKKSTATTKKAAATQKRATVPTTADLEAKLSELQDQLDAD